MAQKVCLGFCCQSDKMPGNMSKNAQIIQAHTHAQVWYGMVSYSICHSISYMVYPMWVWPTQTETGRTSDDISRMPGGRVSISALAACYFIFEQGEAVRFNDVITQHTTSRARAANLANREQTLSDFLALSVSLSSYISLFCSYHFNKAPI